MKVLNVVGARPNFVKIAPLMEAMKQAPQIEALLVHTGQHYDANMSDVFFTDLDIPPPDIRLGIGPGTPTEQTARIMLEFEQVCLRERPDLVVVVGDVNSTLATALVAAQLHIPVAHVEAGLRSYDPTMPEELNRRLTDAMSDLLFTTCRDATENLLRESVAAERIHFVGNIMIDTLLKYRERAAALDLLSQLGLAPQAYALVTLHRPSNVDDAGVLKGILEGVRRIAKTMPVIFPAHPRTQKRLQEFGLEGSGIQITNPFGYLEFLNLTSNARVVLTDSGGLQEETTVLRVPCLTLRDNTERPVTIVHGTNALCGTLPEAIYRTFQQVTEPGWTAGGPPELWDGHAAGRIVDVLTRWKA